MFFVNIKVVINMLVEKYGIDLKSNLILRAFTHSSYASVHKLDYDYEFIY